MDMFTPLHVSGSPGMDTSTDWLFLYYHFYVILSPTKTSSWFLAETFETYGCCAICIGRKSVRC